MITCQNDAPVGTPKATSEGLTCENGKSTKVQIDRDDLSISENSIELKAGSKRHQHIVGFESLKGGQTRFALVELDLPAGLENSSTKSD